MNFSRWAKPYNWLTDHALWRTGMREVAKQLPPSAAQLKLLDVSSGTGTSLRDLTTLRPDILPIAADLAWGMVKTGRGLHPQFAFVNSNALHLPFPDNSMDAVLIQRTYYFLPQKAELLAEALRVLRAGGRLILVNPAEGYTPSQAWHEWRTPKGALDMFLWHSIAQRINRYTPERIARELAFAGYARILAEPILNGWAMLARGEKPYPSNLTTPERVLIGASERLEDEKTDPILRGEQVNQLKGRFVHLLIRQTPNKPAWKLAPEEVLTWGAVGVPSGFGDSLVLAFTSLPKAVSFMQAAVLAGWVQDVNKVGKFSLATATAWDFPLLVNPDLETVQARYAPPVWVGVDPHSAEAPDE